MRIVVLQNIGQWIGNIEEQEYLDIPDAMDMDVEEKKWFVTGGGTLQDFVAHLIANGAVKLSIETWVIRYL